MKNQAHYFIKLFTLLLTATTAQANVDLIAIGEVNANALDRSEKTAGLLENGVAGNLLGGIGSGLAYAGDNTFIAIADRGPNATPYNLAVDETTSYITRFHTFKLKLLPNPGYNSASIASLPYKLSPYLANTKLLYSHSPLTYAASGIPAINKYWNHYFTGRSDNFDANKNSTNPLNGRLDPEGVRVANNGKSVFISDEYGPYIYQFDRESGRRIKTLSLPNYFAITSLNAQGDKEIADNKLSGGRTANKGMEGLAITPDGKTLVGIMQTELLQDTKKYLRIVTLDIATNITHEYSYLLTVGSGVSEILAINSTEFLVLERDGKGLGDNSTAKVKQLFKVSLAGATDLSGIAKLDAATQQVTTVTKTPFLDVVAQLKAVGINANDIPAKIESIAFGPDITVANTKKHTLFLVSDNDFLATITDSNHPAGMANPSKFFVFAVDGSDVPSYVPQRISSSRDDDWLYRLFQEGH